MEEDKEQATPGKETSNASSAQPSSSRLRTVDDAGGGYDRALHAEAQASQKLRDVTPDKWLNIPVPIVETLSLYRDELLHLQNASWATRAKQEQISRKIDETTAKHTQEYFDKLEYLRLEITEKQSQQEAALTGLHEDVEAEKAADLEKLSQGLQEDIQDGAAQLKADITVAYKNYVQEELKAAMGLVQHNI